MAEKKFLDQEGVKYLWSKISMEDYPNNNTLVAVLNAIDETKQDKIIGKGLSTNDFTTEEKNKLASLKNTTIDTTLTISNAAADAKVVGDLWRAVADDDDVTWLLAQLGLIQKLADEVGVILTDEVGNILLI